MRQILGRQFWLGNAGDLRDPQVALEAGVQAIVELADNEPFAVLPRELIRLRFPVSDSGANSHWVLRFAAESVATLVKAEVPTLVACSSGLNRSVCIAAAGLALATNQALDDTLRAIAKGGPADVSPRLLAQVRAEFGI